MTLDSILSFIESCSSEDFTIINNAVKERNTSQTFTNVIPSNKFLRSESSKYSYNPSSMFEADYTFYINNPGGRIRVNEIKSFISNLIHRNNSLPLLHGVFLPMEFEIAPLRVIHFIKYPLSIKFLDPEVVEVRFLQWTRN